MSKRTRQDERMGRVARVKNSIITYWQHDDHSAVNLVLTVILVIILSWMIFVNKDDLLAQVVAVLGISTTVISALLNWVIPKDVPDTVRQTLQTFFRTKWLSILLLSALVVSAASVRKTDDVIILDWDNTGDDARVIIAQFAGSDSVDTNPTKNIEEVLQQPIDELEKRGFHTQTRPYPAEIATVEEALRIGQKNNATMVIYGRVEPCLVVVYYTITVSIETANVPDVVEELYQTRIPAEDLPSPEISIPCERVLGPVIRDGITAEYMFHLVTGQLLMTSGNFQEAREAFDRAIAWYIVHKEQLPPEVLTSLNIGVIHSLNSNAHEWMEPYEQE